MGFLFQRRKRKRQEQIHCNEEQRVRMENYRKAMEELIAISEEGLETNRALYEPDAEKMYRMLTDAVCRKCPRFRLCFGEESEETMQQIREIFLRISEVQKADPDVLPADFRRKCVYVTEFLEELLWLHRFGCQEVYWKNRMYDLRMRMNQQMKVYLRFFQEIWETSTEDQPLEKAKRKKISSQLYRKGVRLLYAQEQFEDEESIRIVLGVKSMFRPVRSIEILDVLNEVYQTEFQYIGEERYIRKEGSRFVFVKKPNYVVLFGVCHQSGNVERKVCGDTFSFEVFGKSKAVLMLSDGTGTGKEAYQESRKIIEIMEDLLEAGIPEEFAVELLHYSLQMRKKELYATLDIAIISLKTGTLKFLKAGGASSFLKHGNQVERIAPTTLPPGCESGMAFDLQCKKLYDGDILVMVSDGMLAFEMMSELEMNMEQILKEIETKNAQTFSRQLMDKVPVLYEEHEDDRTVLVATVWKKG